MAPMIVVAGEALIDLLVDADGALSAIPGGGPFNTARTIARLGGSVAYLGCLSTDRFGGILRDALVADGVDLSLTGTTDAPTTLAIAELDPDGAATYRFHTAETSAPQVGPAAVAAALATGPRALHLGTLGLVLEPMASALADGAADAPPDTLVMLDPNCRPAVIADRERVPAPARSGSSPGPTWSRSAPTISPTSTRACRPSTRHARSLAADQPSSC